MSGKIALSLLAAVAVSASSIALAFGALKIAEVSDDDIVQLHSFDHPARGKLVQLGDIVGIKPDGSSFDRICKTSDLVGEGDFRYKTGEYVNLVALAMGDHDTFSGSDVANQILESGRRKAKFNELTETAVNRIYASIGKDQETDSGCECQIVRQIQLGRRACVVTTTVTALSADQGQSVGAYAVKYTDGPIFFTSDQVEALRQSCSFVSGAPVNADVTVACSDHPRGDMASKLRVALGVIEYRSQVSAPLGQ